MPSTKKVFIIEGLRTPFVKAGKEFSSLHPAVLASQNLKEFLYKTNFPKDEIEEVILGNCFTLPDSSNIARVVALQAGLPKKVSATTTSRNCASSMESFVTGTAKIQAGLNSCIMAGGVESMSYVPLMLSLNLSKIIQNVMLSKTWKQKIKTLSSIRLKDFTVTSPILEGLKDPFTGYSMGKTAELLAQEFHISRKEQDEFTLLSHKKACEGRQNLKEEIFPFVTKSKTINQDTGPKSLLSQNKLARFQPYFDKKYGTLTIANSCSMNDGSSMLLLMSEDKMKSMNLKPLASVIGSSFVGLEPQKMGLGPVLACAMALKKAGLSLKDMDLIEINEAFAAQVLACLQAFSSKKFCEKQLNLPQALGEVNPEKLNVNGGALAIGHPISATGTRLILTLAKEMKRRQVQFGLASLCIGGGQGGVVILENAS